ncbi:MAG: hypothetical protein ABI581_10865 [Sediminibacterium sp.]
MSDILLESIVEKLEGIEVFLKAINTGSPQPVDLTPILSEISALKKDPADLPGKLSLHAKKLAELEVNMASLLQQLKLPLNNKIEHKHHLHKGIWLSAGLFLVLVFLIWGWLNTYSKLEQYEGNDIKYRYFKVYGNQALIKFCGQIDGLYLKDKSGFRDSIEQEEQRLFRQWELNRLAGENEREANTLREQAGRK